MPRKPNKSGDHYFDPFPTHLRELIDEQDQKQDDLTEILGVKSRQSVTGYIDGSTAPTADKIVAIAKAYNVSADWLLGLSDVRSPDMDVQAVCRFTGLSEYAIRVLKLGETTSRAINLLANILLLFFVLYIFVVLHNLFCLILLWHLKLLVFLLHVRIFCLLLHAYL